MKTFIKLISLVISLVAGNKKLFRKMLNNTEFSFTFSDITTSYERISDHCSNIAVSLIQIHEDNYENHQYLNDMKHNDVDNFKRQYDEYRRNYILPEVKFLET